MAYELFYLYEGMLFKARDFLVIRWGQPPRQLLLSALWRDARGLTSPGEG